MLGSTPIRLAVLQNNGIGGGRSDTYRPDCTLEYLHKVDQQVFGCPYSSKYFFMISSQQKKESHTSLSQYVGDRIFIFG